MPRKAANQMSHDLSEVSLAIGELRAGQAAQREALGEIKDSLKHITASLSSLPPSPVCTAKHAELDEHLKETDKKVTWLTTKVSAIIMVGATGVKFGLNKLGIDL